MLQTRSAKRTAAAAVKIAADMVDEGMITKEEAVARIEPAHVDQLLRDQFDPAALKGATKRIANGPQRLARRRRRPGRVRRRHRRRVGRARRAGRSSSASRPRPTTSTAWPSRRASSPPAAAPPRTRRSSRARSASRASPAARSSSIDYAAQAARCTVTGIEFKEGDWVSLDGSTGELYLGALPTVEARFEDQPELQKILGWADEIRRMGVWTNADKPEEAAQARGYGAEGIGLCRTEHMFREGERLEIVRGAILVANQATRAKAKARGRRGARRPTSSEAVATFDAAMAKLEVLQQGDFEGIFEAMDGLPVVIRLIDPPLHEFLPNLEEQLVKVTRAESHRRRVRGGQGAARDDQVAARAEPDARPARLPPGPDDPGLREDPDAGHPQRPDRGQARPAATRSPRS